MDPYKLKYIGVVQILLEKHNRLCRLGAEFDDEEINQMQAIAADFNKDSTSLEMQPAGGCKWAIFDK